MRRFSLSLVLSLALLLAAPCLAGFEEHYTFSADRFEVTNLIGTVRVEGHAGSGYEVHVSVEGSDANPDTIRIETREGAAAGLAVVFPLDRHTRYVYPELGSSKTTISLNDQGGGWISRILDGISGSNRIEVRGSGTGLEVWADIVVKVPRGGSVNVSHAVGGIEAEGVSGDVDLKVQAGSVVAASIDGDLNVDTGSGSVSVSDVNGDLLVDTGSGNVTVDGFDGERFDVDTGSGHVAVESIRADTISIDTGSGRVRASGVSANEAEIDTGSGSVTLELDRMGDGRFDVDTGSGSISIKLPPDASARLKADTGSGGIDLDLGGAAQIMHQERDSLEAQIGDGGARLDLDAGSGSIRITF